MQRIVLLFTFLFAFFLFVPVVNASTTYESDPPIQQELIDFTGNSTSDGNQRYVMRIRLPLGTQFDRIQMARQAGGTIYPIMVTDGSDGRFEDCVDSGCVAGDSFAPSPLSITNTQQIEDYVIQYTFSSITTITASNQYFYIAFDPNTSYSFGNNIVFNDVIWSEDGYGLNRQNKGSAFRVCNGSCTDSSFNDIPNLTAEAWGRMVSPFDSTTQPYSVNFNFQFNWGTTTDNAIIRFNSDYQSILPQNVTANISGLQTETFTRNFPAIDDDLEIALEMYSGSSSVYISPTYTIKLRNISQLESDLQNPSPSACDNIIVGALCSIASFLFIPSETPTQTFSAVLDNIETKKPFSYFSQTTSVISTVASSSTSAEFVNLEVTINLPPVTGTYPILTKETLDNIYDTDTRLMVRSVIGYGLWIIFALTVIYMLLNIFNRAVYLGEQGNEKQSFSNRTKTIHER